MARWINAVIEARIPLDVSVDASPAEKLGAAAERTDADDVALPDGGVIYWEEVEDGEPIAGPHVETEDRRNSLLKALRGEVEAQREKADNRSADASKLRRDRSRHRFEGAALTHRMAADRLQAIIDQHEGGGEHGE